VGCLAYRFPFEGVRIEADSRYPSPSTQWPLMRLVALQSVMNIEVVDVLGCLLPPRTCCFQQFGGLPSVPSPVPLRVRVHPLVSYTSPTEYVLLCHPSDPNAETLASNTSQGLLPIRDMSNWSQPIDELPRLTFVSSSAFLTLPTISSSNYRVGLFHPTATSGICTSGVFPATKPAHLVDESYPHVVGGSLLPVSCPTSARYSHSAFRA